LPVGADVAAAAAVDGEYDGALAAGSRGSRCPTERHGEWPEQHVVRRIDGIFVVLEETQRPALASRRKTAAESSPRPTT
jgi:hypothetical protein